VTVEPPALLPLEDELPPIEQFLDDLPSIDDYVVEATASAVAVPEGWAAAEWQEYDWQSLSQLAAPAVERERPRGGWAEDEWPAESPASIGPAARTAADEVADALDAMARRIRSGELSIDQLRGAAPEAAMAAALAALVRLRR
jgi:hypothetical protein